MTSPSGTSTDSVIAAFFNTGFRLATIWSVASLRLNCRRSACDRSTATCLNDWISSPARCRFATSCPAASREVLTNSSSLERRSGSVRNSCSNVSARRAKLDATVRLMPIGLLTSWATPATSPPSAASRSASIRFCCAALSSSSALSAFSFEARSSSSVLRLAMAFSRNTSTARAMAPTSSLAVVPCTGDRNCPR